MCEMNARNGKKECENCFRMDIVFGDCVCECVPVINDIYVCARYSTMRDAFCGRQFVSFAHVGGAKIYYLLLHSYCPHSTVYKSVFGPKFRLIFQTRRTKINDHHQFGTRWELPSALISNIWFIDGRAKYLSKIGASCLGAQFIDLDIRNHSFFASSIEISFPLTAQCFSIIQRFPLTWRRSTAKSTETIITSNRFWPNEKFA